MSLFGLRPEEPAAIRIREAATRGTLSHALLLTGSGDRMSAACFAAAALECTGEESRPCGVCPACSVSTAKQGSEPPRGRDGLPGFTSSVSA